MSLRRIAIYFRMHPCEIKVSVASPRPEVKSGSGDLTEQDDASFDWSSAARLQEECRTQIRGTRNVTGMSQSLYCRRAPPECCIELNVRFGRPRRVTSSSAQHRLHVTENLSQPRLVVTSSRLRKLVPLSKHDGRQQMNDINPMRSHKYQECTVIAQVHLPCLHIVPSQRAVFECLMHLPPCGGTICLGDTCS
jgi:hypothetical protein